MSTLAISGADGARLFDGLHNSNETAWLLTARSAANSDLLLGRRLHDVPANAYLQRGPTRLKITSAGFVPAISHAKREDGLPIFIHTHPESSPSPSPQDDLVDQHLAAHTAARDISGYASLILGGTPALPRFSGRVFDAQGNPRQIDRLRIAGRDIRLLLADEHQSLPVSAIFDRHVRAFGPLGQRLFSQLRVGVVGAGGTGSATIEQLARLGVGDIVIVDDDKIENTNLTRIHGATVDHLGQNKADVAARLAQEYGTGARARAIVANVANRASIHALRSCDIVFGCTDDHAGRLILSRLAYHYLLPVIDCGVMIDVNRGRVNGIIGRVTIMAPGEPCLICRGQVDPRLASEEMMDPEQRRTLAGEGYARGADAPAPAVVAFTTATASLAVNEMLARLLGYADSTSTQLLLRLHTQTITRAGRPAVAGHHCVDPTQWGLGDTDPILGLVGLG